MDDELRIEVAALRLVIQDILSEVARNSDNPAGFLQEMKAHYQRLGEMAMQNSDAEKAVKMLSTTNDAEQIVEDVAGDLEIVLE